MKKKILILVQMLAVMSLCIACGSTKDNHDITNQVTKADSYTQGAKTYVWETDENTINEAVEAGTEAVENKELLKQKLRLDDNLRAAAGKDIFSDDIKMGKTILNDYKLSFDKKDNGNHGMTYTLKSVTSPDGDVTYAGDNFFPLNNAKSNTLDKGYASADGKNSTNYYFGMRYDLSFTLNGYTGDLLYKFTGDDDLWVFLDGELVLDLGGIHAECGGDVDLWRVGPLADELYATGNKELVNADTKHTLTVLYMERGGNESNCNMQFTVPDTVTIDPPHEDYEWNVEKNVILTDWDNRTYDITLDVTSDKVYKEVISGALIRDYIDNRFNILDDNGRAITKDIIDNSNEDIYVNSGRIGYDDE